MDSAMNSPANSSMTSPGSGPAHGDQPGGEIIDARLRPPFLHRFFGAEPASADGDVVRWLNRRLGAEDPEHFVPISTLDRLTAAMDQAGIGRGIVVGRSTPTVRIANDDIAGLARRSSGRLLGVASIDPVELERDAALAEAERAVRSLGLAAINFDAGFYARPLRADDPLLMPLYEACLALGVPAFIMSGPTTPDLSFNDPLAIDHVARTFPKLPIVCCHGCYPRIDDIVAVAFRNENVFVSPDMYVFAPGGHRYVEAARGFLAEQLLFGTSFPFRPMRQTVDQFRALLPDLCLRAKVMGGNARRLLGLAG
jgi:predicted TIM-barrel fold metal-dependent hydrolase